VLVAEESEVSTDVIAVCDVAEKAHSIEARIVKLIFILNRFVVKNNKLH